MLAVAKLISASRAGYSESLMFRAMHGHRHVTFRRPCTLTLRWALHCSKRR